MSSFFSPLQEETSHVAMIDHKEVSNMFELMQELKRCNEEHKLIFLKAGALWCKPCKQIKPFYHALMEHWSKQVSLCFLDFNVDESEPLAAYFQVENIPYFICLLPSSHPTLTTKELRYVGSDPVQLERWFTNIMQKWIVGIQSEN
jgi:thiol-disulfide isomerase/thioredoxin